MLLHRIVVKFTHKHMNDKYSKKEEEEQNVLIQNVQSLFIFK